MKATYPDLFVFDLDGTLIRLNIDFEAVRRALGLKGRYILESIFKLPEEERRRRLELLKRFEIEYAKRAEPMPYAGYVLDLLGDLGIGRCIVTRNCRESVDIVLERLGFEVDFVVTRDDAKPKPSPEPIKLAIERFGTSPKGTIVVGDYVFDIVAGKRAGARTALLLNERNLKFARMADYVLKSLKDVENLLR